MNQQLIEFRRRFVLDDASIYPQISKYPTKRSPSSSVVVSESGTGNGTQVEWDKFSFTYWGAPSCHGCYNFNKMWVLELADIFNLCLQFVRW